MEHKFFLRYYPKSRTIQFKPYDDKHVHFSVAWVRNSSSISTLGGKPMNSMTVEDFETNVYQPIINYLNKVNWKLQFRPVKACENCTYGHFDEEFEDLLLELRKKFPTLCADKEFEDLLFS